MRRSGLARLLVAVTMAMTFAEFMEVQKLSPDDLRKRFGLLPTCDPAVTALTTDPAANRMTVAIECRAAPSKKPTPRAPTSAPR